MEKFITELEEAIHTCVGKNNGLRLIFLELAEIPCKVDSPTRLLQCLEYCGLEKFMREWKEACTPVQLKMIGPRLVFSELHEVAPRLLLDRTASDDSDGMGLKKVPGV